MATSDRNEKLGAPSPEDQQVSAAFTAAQAAKLAGISKRQATGWDKAGLLSPSYPSGLYSFRDVVGLRTLGMLRRDYKVSLQKLKGFNDWLVTHSFNEPWATKRFAMAGREVILVDDDNQLVSGDVPGQHANAFVINLKRVETALRRRTKELMNREEDEIGRVIKNRGVCHNRPRLAGTRITTKAIVDAIESGMTPDEVVQQFPTLKPADVDAAIRFEAQNAA